MTFPSLVSSIVDLMAERERAKRAKINRLPYNNTDPELTIRAIEYYIKANLLLIQSAGRAKHGDVCVL